MEDQRETWECKLEDGNVKWKTSKRPGSVNWKIHLTSMTEVKNKNGRAGNKASPFSKLKTAETDVQCSLTLSCMKSTAGLAPPPVPFTAY